QGERIAHCKRVTPFRRREVRWLCNVSPFASGASAGAAKCSISTSTASDAPFHASFKSIFDGRRVIRAEFSPGFAARSCDRHCTAGWLFRHFPLPPAVPFPRFGDTPKGRSREPPNGVLR